MTSNTLLERNVEWVLVVFNHSFVYWLFIHLLSSFYRMHSFLNCIVNYSTVLKRHKRDHWVASDWYSILSMKCNWERRDPLCLGNFFPFLSPFLQPISYLSQVPSVFLFHKRKWGLILGWFLLRQFEHHMQDKFEVHDKLLIKIVRFSYMEVELHACGREMIYGKFSNW